ncbi:Splicing factor U2AF-associated protein 2 [Sphaceloma murrayae]|uniref:Splicing factor U2AF-associated protein 2 n=1 Tax=Sphaceloma murrayae TaxID=2082308 RepID=A0A2K1R1A4_9PEZI|nr:Splicing factor U2AF-associated protein 2 [Sphaceloma murrayae]
MEGKTFPKSLEDFKDDDRVSFDTTKGVYILESGDGKEFEWNERHSNWVEQMDEDLVKAQQSAYYAAEEQDDTPQESKKRKADGKSTASSSKKAKKEPTERVNSSVYVTGLPHDAKFDEIFDIFSRKGGLIANNVDSETPKIKMYANEDGSFKGEALITFFRPESVQMAIDLLDATDLRTYMSGDMRVQVADMSYKKHKEYKAGDGDKKGRPGKDVAKIKKMTEKMNSRLADWDDDDPQVVEEEVKPASKFDKTVYVKHMFTLEEMEEEPELLLELPEDIREKAEEEEWGAITTIDVFDKEPDGVVKIRFKDAKSAMRAVMNMDGRIFGGHQLEAYVATKREVYRKSDRDVDEEEEERRLKKYGEELEKGEA